MNRASLAFAVVALTACRRAPGASLPPPVASPRIEVADAGSSSFRAVPRVPAGGCPATDRAALGPGTLHGGMVRTAETWTLAGSPHHLPLGAQIIEGASVTVDPCAVVLVAEGRGITVEERGALVAVGDASHPIVFAPDTATPRPGDWLGIEISEGARPETRFAHASIEHGGRDLQQRGEPSAALRSAMQSEIWLDHVAVRDSATWGVALTRAAGFSESSRELTVTGARGAGAVYFSNADAVRTLPTGRFSGNAHDDIVVAARERYVATSGTWRNPGEGVRYRVAPSAHVMVQGAEGPVLTLAAGVRVAFEDDAELDVGWDAPGGLIADGGDARGTIVMTSARETLSPATWTGLFFGPRTDVIHSRIRHVRIEGAGAESGFGMVICQPDEADVGDDAMVVLQGVDAPELIAQTVFVAGPPSGYAIARSGVFDAAPGDLTAPRLGNDFSRSGTRCAQSTARVGGLCPRENPCAHGAAAPSQRDGSLPPSVPATGPRPPSRTS